MDHYSSYAKKLSSLRKELSVMRAALRKKKKDFNENQLKGFMHILLCHYGDDSTEGCLSAKNILNIATTIKMGSPYQSKKMIIRRS